MDQQFDHERLDVYQVARELSREVQRITELLPRGGADSKDNLLRSVKSITRNIAEASGRWGRADRTQFLQIARASTAECAASLEELVDFKLLPPHEIVLAKTLCWREVSMLVRLIRSMEDPRR